MHGLRTIERINYNRVMEVEDQRRRKAERLEASAKVAVSESERRRLLDEAAALRKSGVTPA